MIEQLESELKETKRKLFSLTEQFESLARDTSSGKTRSAHIKLVLYTARMEHFLSCDHPDIYKLMRTFLQTFEPEEKP